jgi:predicted ATPase
MRISNLRLVGFKRFADLTVQDLPTNARLVVLAGPNGNGKSSLFDGMLNWRRRHSGMGNSWDLEYHARDRTKEHRADAVSVIFHDPAPKSADEIAASIHMRTAHRNDPTVQLQNVANLPPVTRDVRFERLSANDRGVSRNLQLLMGQDLETLYSSGNPATTFGEHRSRLQGRINQAFSRLDLKLTMDGLGNPLQTKTFRFSKGDVSGYHFDNLSGGERAIFDLLFDLIVQREAFGDAVYCIDEPESHVNPNLHNRLLQELLSLVPDGGQLWVATHSIGMLRKARDMQRCGRPGEVVFLDFDQNFDQPVVLSPVMPGPLFWKRALSTAVGDVADLVAPEIIVFCEGHNPGHELGEGTDAKIYARIFASEVPEAVFTSLGGSNDVLGRLGDGVSRLFATIKGTTVIRLIDGDNQSPSERSELEKRGIRVLSRRHIESYLFDDEILRALCASLGREGHVDHVLKLKQDAIDASVIRGHTADDVKKWCSDFRAKATKALGVPGQSDQGFMLDVLSPLVTREMRIFQELKADIFGGSHRIG